MAVQGVPGKKSEVSNMVKCASARLIIAGSRFKDRPRSRSVETVLSEGAGALKQNNHVRHLDVLAIVPSLAHYARIAAAEVVGRLAIVHRLHRHHLVGAQQGVGV